MAIIIESDRATITRSPIGEPSICASCHTSVGHRSYQRRQVDYEERGVGLLGWPEVLLDVEEDLDGFGLEPAAAARRQMLRRLRLFCKPASCVCSSDRTCIL